MDLTSLLDLHSPKGHSIVVYDLEIKASIGSLTPDGRKVGWTSFGDMGVSVGVSYDYRDGDFRTFFDDNLGELASQLESAEVVVGFNQIGFDNNLLGATLGKPPAIKRQYDILVESRKALGWVEGGRFPSGCKLDNHLEAMFGKAVMKTGHGELAPLLYQKKQWGPLVSYCIADVRRTCMVFEHIWEFGTVKTVIHGEKKVSDPRILIRN